MRRAPRSLVMAAVSVLVLACGGRTLGDILDHSIRKSQHATVTQRVGYTDIAIEYNRPVARGRALFGGIVPYGAPWNPGADKATSISFSKDVTIDGRPVPSGKYSIWFIPDTTRWVFILSHAANVYHTPYPSGKDALRLPVTPQQAPYMETLGFYFPTVDSTHAELVMHWGATVVPLRIEAQ